MGIVDVSKGVQYLESHGVPNYAFPEAAVRSMASLAFYGNLLSLDNRKVRRVAADRDTANAIIKKKLTGKEKESFGLRKKDLILQAATLRRVARKIAALKKEIKVDITNYRPA